MRPFFALVGLICLVNYISVAALPQSWYSSVPTNENLMAVTYGEGQLIVVGWYNTILRSTDGFAWTQAGTGSADPFYSAAYGNGIFVAGGQVGHLVSISPDGVNWTNSWRSIGSQRIYGLTFGNGRFVGVGSTGPSLPIMIVSSGDGIHWVGPARYPSSNTLYGVTYGNGLFVAVGSGGTVMTSPDADSWTLRNSGTTNNLRAVTATDTGFIAGGDKSTIIVSSDGLSWSAGAPPAFDVKGLAWGNGAVVAVGNYQNDGRLHASTDGLGWPGNPTLVSRALNGVAYVNGHFVGVGVDGLVVQSDVSTQNGTNDWTNSSSGNWEEPNWSLGELPSINHALIRFANPGYKALAINYATTVNYPNSLQIRNLTVDAPSDSYNTLLLNYAGLQTPLQITENLRIGYHGALLNYSSALTAGTLSIVDGQATFAEGAQGQFQYLRIGHPTAAGTLTISNAELSTAYLQMADRLNQYGGSNVIGNLIVWVFGKYSLNNGTVIVTNGASVDGQLTEGQFIEGEGNVKIAGGLALGSVHSPNGSGTFRLQGGALESDSIIMMNGNYFQSGGTSLVGNMYVKSNGFGYITLTGGTMTSERVDMGEDFYLDQHPYGTFLQTGGIHTNHGAIIMWGRYPSGDEGVYLMKGGELNATNGTYVAGGRFEQSGGIHRTDFVGVTLGRFILDGGVLESGYTTVQGGTFIQNGGTHDIKDALFVRDNGTYYLNGGSLSMTNLILLFGPGGFRGGNGNISQSGIFAMTDASFVAPSGTHQLGVLHIDGRLGRPSVSEIALQSGGATILRFRDSHAVSWSEYGWLSITNWAGSLLGGGADQIHFGASTNGLTASQLFHISFVNPVGLPSGGYGAKLLATGELVPYSNGPVVGYSRTAQGLALVWNTNSYELLSSTNVAGPYEWITPQPSSPYTVNFTEPQRFFELRQINP